VDSTREVTREEQEKESCGKMRWGRRKCDGSGYASEKSDRGGQGKGDEKN